MWEARKTVLSSNVNMLVEQMKSLREKLDNWKLSESEFLGITKCICGNM